MAHIQSYKSYFPKIAEDVFLAESATVIGQVEIGSKSSVWYNAVVRGDVGLLKIGERTSLQDGVIVHCTTDISETHIGNDVVVGHGAILHGCTIADEVLVGMGAILLDLCEIPSHTLIAAGALIPEGKVLEAGYIYAGVPAKPIKRMTEEQIDNILITANRYVGKARWYRESQGAREEK
ncbi:MAG: gamma carbonic anhydrase family protein [Bacteroidota bacterium]